MAPPAATVSVPPTVALETDTPVESVKLASSLPCVSAVKVPKALAALLSAMAPVEKTLSAPAVIAVDWVTLWPPSVRVPAPLTALPMLRS